MRAYAILQAYFANFQAEWEIANLGFAPNKAPNLAFNIDYRTRLVLFG